MTGRLTRAGRTARVVAVLVMGGLLTVGTFLGDDDAFPFGPLRMFSTSSNPNGAISVVALEARTQGGPWEPVPLSPRVVGLNRAEVEGQLDRFQADPELLEELSQARDRMYPGQPPWTALRLLRRSTVLEDRVPTGEVRETVLSEWSP